MNANYKVMKNTCTVSAADKHRVTLKGEIPDYIHATYVNVSSIIFVELWYTVSMMCLIY